MYMISKCRIQNGVRFGVFPMADSSMCWQKRRALLKWLQTGQPTSVSLLIYKWLLVCLAQKFHPSLRGLIGPHENGPWSKTVCLPCLREACIPATSIASLWICNNMPEMGGWGIFDKIRSGTVLSHRKEAFWVWNSKWKVNNKCACMWHSCSIITN